MKQHKTLNPFRHCSGWRYLFLSLLLLLSPTAFAAGDGEALNLTATWVGIVSLIVFTVAYVLVIFEEQLHLSKSKPVLAAAGVIWLMIGIYMTQSGDTHSVEHAIRHYFLEYAELFFFLLVAMTYINALIERGVFEELRSYLVSKGFSYKQLFWITGILAFFISPIADNLTTALILCAVLLAVGKGQAKFIGVGCVNIVVAANAGGVFSPFGDITTLMVWQKGKVEFTEFLVLFIPSAINYLVPAIFMQFAVPQGSPEPIKVSGSLIKPGGVPIIFMFLATIVTAVSFHHFMHIPPVFGMLLGLAYVKLYAFYLSRTTPAYQHLAEGAPDDINDPVTERPLKFDIFRKVAAAEWDTLFFFYGVIMAVGGLGFIGYLSYASVAMYTDLGATNANILVGFLSAIIDNIPVMFAVLTMNPDMDHFQWLLITLTAGAGGSMLAVGSAAGVALMGQAKGYYTFFGHLRWSPVIILGYFASIGVHFLLNSHLIGYTGH